MAESYGPYPGVVQERRIRLTVETPVGVAELTGKPDWYDADRGYVEDWKSTATAPQRPYDDHIAQVNIYAFLIEKGRYDPQDRPETCSDDGYQPDPDDPVKTYAPLKVHTAAIRYIDHARGPAIPVELWSQRAAEEFIVQHMTPLVRWQQTGELPIGYTRGDKGFWKSSYCPFRGTGKCCADRGE